MSIVAKRLDGSRCHLVRRYRSRSRRHCVICGPSFPLPPKKDGHSSPRTIRPIGLSIVVKRLDGLGYHLVRGRPWPRRHCVRWGVWGPSSPNGKEHSSPPLFGPCLLWPNGCPSQQMLRCCLTRCIKAILYNVFGHTTLKSAQSHYSGHTGLVFPALRRNLLFQLHFRFSHQIDGLFM